LSCSAQSRALPEPHVPENGDLFIQCVILFHAAAQQHRERAGLSRDLQSIVRILMPERGPSTRCPPPFTYSVRHSAASSGR
jgi:hypothetical protein